MMLQIRFIARAWIPFHLHEGIAFRFLQLIIGRKEGRSSWGYRLATAVSAPFSTIV
jgi:hypothetical protein